MKKSKFLYNVSHENSGGTSSGSWWDLADSVLELGGRFVDSQTEAEKAKQAASNAAQAQAQAAAAKEEKKSDMIPWLVGGGVVVLIVVLIIVLKK